MSTVYGYICEWDGFRDVPKDSTNSHYFQSVLEEISVFSMAKERSGFAPKWQKVRFNSIKPLWGEEAELKPPGFLYTYILYFRVNENTNTIVVASGRYTVTEAVIATFNAYVAPNIKRKLLNVRQLATHLFEKNTERNFAVTYLMADVPGYGAALNTIALHGDDIAATSFLDGQDNNLTARTIGLRPFDSRYECVRFGSTGSVQFRLESLQEFEEFLIYAYERGLYLQ